MEITIGKWRRLQQASSEQGTFTILAIDHRRPLRRALDPQFDGETLDKTISLFKQDVVRELAAAATAVLLDPETGVGPCLTSGALPGQTALIVAMDTGSTGDPAVVETNLIKNWSVRQSSFVGAAGVKLLVYHHPASPNAMKTEKVVEEIGQACARDDIPFFLEPLSYDPDALGNRLSAQELKKVVIETARCFVPLGVDVLKAEFPWNIAESQDPAQWKDACSELSEACAVPWVLLSAGVPFDTFLAQAQIACESGASGVMAGRAVWKEAVVLDAHDRAGFLQGPGRERIKKLRELCDAYGRPFTEIYQPAGADLIDVRGSTADY
jgi:tagatose 1,6-diphosphate aldolase